MQASERPTRDSLCLNMTRPSHSRLATIGAVFFIAILAHVTGLRGQDAEGLESGRGYPGRDWPAVGGNWSSSRYSTLTDITLDTVDRLGGAWVMRPEGGGSARATPVVKDGVLYLTSGASVFAIDAGTGETVWRRQSASPETGRVPSWQGVGLGPDLVFVGLGSGRWRRSAERRVSSSGSSQSAACRAISVRRSPPRRCTRRARYSWDWRTAMPAGRGGLLRSMRRLAKRSGRSSSCRVRASLATRRGLRTRMSGRLGADGYLFLFDRETGDPLVPIEERPVPQDAFQHTAPTQPFPVGVESILPECSFWCDAVPPPFELNCSGFTPPSLNQHAVVAPGLPIPLVRVAPMSYNPQTGYIYAQGRVMVGRARRFEDRWLHWAGGYQVTLPEPVGVVAAIDPRSGTVVWKKESRSAVLGASGPLTTAGGLMLRGAVDGHVEAYDAQTGERVWAFQTGMPGGWRRPGPAVTYDVDGKQYVAIAMGRELWAFTLDGTVPERAAPIPDQESGTSIEFGTAVRQTTQIETSTLVESRFGSVGGRRQAIEEHTFNPIRAQVAVGARVRFRNNGEIAHTVAARDGSWTTGTLEPARFGFVTFDQPGTIIYHCTDHPWAIGEITVEE